jgi:hypothetical protein
VIQTIAAKVGCQVRILKCEVRKVLKESLLSTGPLRDQKLTRAEHKDYEVRHPRPCNT